MGTHVQLSVFLLAGCFAGTAAIRVDEVDYLELQEVVHMNASAAAAVPDDYWTASGAEKRCRVGSIVRGVKRAVGAPLAVVMGVGAGVGAAIAGAYLVSSKFTDVVVVGSFLTGQAVGQGVMHLTSKTIDGLIYLVRGNHHPMCCCPDDPGAGNCSLVGTSRRFKRAVCPDGMKQNALECSSQLQEVITYDANKTVEGCICQHADECATSQTKLHRGHAWCWTSGDCGVRGKWDYCRFAEQTVDGDVSPLSSFVPNMNRKFRAWTDSRRAVAKGRPISQINQECFAAVPEETLEGCAELCKMDGGAPNATAMSMGDEAEEQGMKSRDCVAFAYDRVRRLCIRLPAFLKNAEFKPYLRDVRGSRPGWQNFVLS